MKTTAEKYADLRAGLFALGSVAVAFSGGVDSTFLLWVAHDVLSESAVAVTAVSESFPERERREAEQFCRQSGIRQILCPSEELEIEGFRENPENRCYLCKRELFGRILAIAKENNMAAVAEGSNTDDCGDYRPGLVAVKELGIRSPLREAGLSKAEIRQLSKQIGLPTWDKPSFACLASRFVYGEPITKEKLSMVDRAEEYLQKLGFRQVRVRVHRNLARIEVLPSDFAKLFVGDLPQRIERELRQIGFTYVTLDLGGYQSGSMNRTLSKGDGKG